MPKSYPNTLLPWPCVQVNVKQKGYFGCLSAISFHCKLRMECTIRESNPGHLDGNEVLYH